MATRGEIRDAVYSELEGVAGTYNIEDASGSVVDTVTLDASNIGLRYPEDTEALPSIVYHENYRRQTYNGVGASEDVVTYNQDGSEKDYRWREYIQGQFIIDVRASNESVKEPIYEALRSAFAKYQFGAWDESDLHADVRNVEVLDSTTADTGDTEDAIRGDQLEVRVEFYREYTLDTDNVTQVNLGVDADDDGSTDDTYTTT